MVLTTAEIREVTGTLNCYTEYKELNRWVIQPTIKEMSNILGYDLAAKGSKREVKFYRVEHQIKSFNYGKIVSKLKETPMTDANEPTELSYLEKLRARELKDTPLKQEDTENDFQNRPEDSRLQSS